MKQILFYLLFLMINLQVLAAGAVTPSDTLGADMVNPGYEDKPKWFKESFLDIREDVDEAAESEKRIILYFYQDGCPYCPRKFMQLTSRPALCCLGEIVTKTKRFFLPGSHIVQCNTELVWSKITINPQDHLAALIQKQQRGCVLHTQ